MRLVVGGALGIATASPALLVSPLAAQTGAALAGASAAGAADLLRTQAEVAHAGTELRRARELSRRGMLSDAELDDRTLAFERARADYLRSSLATLSAGRHVVIERAVKRRQADGRVLVRIDLATVSADSVLAPPGDVDGLSDVLRAGELRNLVVSLKADAGPNGAAIGRPFERVIARLPNGERARADFELLEDLPEVVIATSAGDRAEERRVRLENDASVSGVSLRAAQFSLESELGAEVVYDLTLERSGSRAPVLRLDVDGLPDGIRSEFRDAATKTRIVQVRMPEGTVAQHLQLALTLPATATASVRADSVLRFAVVALAVDSGASATRPIARLPLELVGRGAGRVELQPANLFVEAAPGDSVVVPVRVRNVGSRAVADVRLAAENGTQWPVAVVPSRVATLAAGESRTVTLVIRPPPATPTGDYEVRLSAESDGRGPRADVEDRVLRVRVATATGTLGTGALLAAFVVVAAGLVAFARRLVYR